MKNVRQYIYCKDCAFNRTFYNVVQKVHDCWCGAEYDDIYEERMSTSCLNIPPCKRAITHDQLMKLVDSLPE